MGDTLIALHHAIKVFIGLLFGIEKYRVELVPLSDSEVGLFEVLVDKDRVG